MPRLVELARERVEARLGRPARDAEEAGPRDAAHALARERLERLAHRLGLHGLEQRAEEALDAHLRIGEHAPHAETDLGVRVGERALQDLVHRPARARLPVLDLGEVEESAHRLVARAGVAAPDPLDERAGAVSGRERLLGARDGAHDREQEDRREALREAHGPEIGREAADCQDSAAERVASEFATLSASRMTRRSRRRSDAMRGESGRAADRQECAPRVGLVDLDRGAIPPHVRGDHDVCSRPGSES